MHREVEFPDPGHVLTVHLADLRDELKRVTDLLDQVAASFDDPTAKCVLAWAQKELGTARGSLESVRRIWLMTYVVALEDAIEAQVRP